MTKYDIIPMLLQACPGFQAQWDEYIATGREIPPLVYIDIGEFVSYLVDSYKNGELDAIRPAFEILERLLLEGDSETQECAVIGLIEGIQNVSSWEPFGPTVFVPFLKPKSLEAWNQLNEWWQQVPSTSNLP
jgi:hypothetical protein